MTNEQSQNGGDSKSIKSRAPKEGKSKCVHMSARREGGGRKIGHKVRRY